MVLYLNIIVFRNLLTKISKIMCKITTFLGKEKIFYVKKIKNLLFANCMLQNGPKGSKKNNTTGIAKDWSID